MIKEAQPPSATSAVPSSLSSSSSLTDEYRRTPDDGRTPRNDKGKRKVMMEWVLVAYVGDTSFLFIQNPIHLSVLCASPP